MQDNLTQHSFHYQHKRELVLGQSLTALLSAKLAIDVAQGSNEGLTGSLDIGFV